MILNPVVETPGLRPLVDSFADDVLAGLSRTPKSISSKYFYDDRGSRLFERITQLDEYYLTASERQILERHSPAIVDLVASGPLRIVEAGAGDGHKTEILLRHCLQTGIDVSYVPIDICQQSVVDLLSKLRRKLGSGRLPMRGIVADYFDGLAVLRRRGEVRNLVLFLGSSIGNFDHRAACGFLRQLRQSLRPGDHALIGFDLKKDLGLLQRAYDDSQYVTREFNFNLLDRINRELDGRFDRRRFAHHAAYNLRRGCMESFLVSRCDQQVEIAALERSFHFAAWEGVRLERSYKYDLPFIERLAGVSGFHVRQHFFDDRRYFVDSLWEAK